jgi:hypothetical protein
MNLLALQDDHSNLELLTGFMMVEILGTMAGWDAQALSRQAHQVPRSDSEEEGLVWEVFRYSDDCARILITSRVAIAIMTRYANPC